MECKNCGTSNQDNAKFCAGCGADLSLQNAGEGLNINVKEQQVYTAPQQDQNYTQNYNQAPNYQNPQYNQNYNQYYNQGQPQGYGYNTAPIAPPAAGKGMAIAALVLGIVSFFCFPAITGTLGIIFGCVAKGKGCRSGMATAGIICGAIGIALWIIMLILGFSFMPF